LAKSDLIIDILGTTITITADEDPEYLNKLLGKYKKTIDNVKKISGLKDPLKLAVLTGYLLCDDLEKAGSLQLKTEDSSEAEELTLGMISRLEDALKITETVNEEAEAEPQEINKEAEAKPQEISEEAETEPQEINEEAEAKPQEINKEAPAEKNFKIYKLQNSIKNYAWGSAEWIPALLEEKNLSRIPWAELWMGVNPAGPSRIMPDDAGENPLLLSELIEKDKEFYLGKEMALNFGNLPFLFKVLAAAKPLSIQAHPNLIQAREGFERENRMGIPVDAPNRNYRNPNHKPEIICALLPFLALSGFRKGKETAFILEILSQGSEGALLSGFENLLFALNSENENPYKAFLLSLFGLNKDVLKTLGLFIKDKSPSLQNDFPEYKNEWKLCSLLAGLYPGDPGILAPIYLNIVELSPGEAMFIPAGVLHSYIYGLGMELMADSDNVLRGGLTSKNMDQDELMEILNFSENIPEILTKGDPSSAWFTYKPLAREFKLSVMKGQGSPVTFPEEGPSIVFISNGSTEIKEEDKEDSTVLKKGESAFIPYGKKGRIVFSGSFTAYSASAGFP